MKVPIKVAVGGRSSLIHHRCFSDMAVVLRSDGLHYILYRLNQSFFFPFFTVKFCPSVSQVPGKMALCCV